MEAVFFRHGVTDIEHAQGQECPLKHAVFKSAHKRLGIIYKLIIKERGVQEPINLG